jgi:predicted RNase H-like HicB family nuclease
MSPSIQKLARLHKGETVEEALANLGEATGLYLEEFPLSINGRPLLTSFQVPEHA